MNPGIIDALVVQAVDVEDDLQGLTELLQPWEALEHATLSCRRKGWNNQLVGFSWAEAPLTWEAIQEICSETSPVSPNGHSSNFSKS